MTNVDKCKLCEKQIPIGEGYMTIGGYAYCINCAKALLNTKVENDKENKND